ncbi:MAG TPA: methyl-accepting chemotaxis protein [Tissierellaceae bacterium]
MKSLKTRLIFYFTIMILLSSLAVGLISIYYSSTSLTKEAEKSLFVMAKEGAALAESRIETEFKVLETIAGLEDVKSMDWLVQNDVLNNLIDETNFLALGVVGPDGLARYTDGIVENLADRDHIKIAFNGVESISDIIPDVVNGGTLMRYAVPIDMDGKIVGVLVGRRDGGNLSLITEDIGYGEQGYSYIINSKGTVMAHPNKELVLNLFNPIYESENDKNLESLANAFNKILEEREGLTTYTYNGNDLYAAYMPIKGTDWILIITANVDEVLSSVPKMRNNMLIASAIIILINIVIAYFIGNSISKPIIQLKGYAEKVSNLDLTENLHENLLAKEDEVGLLSRVVQHLVDNLREIIKEIDYSSNEVLSTSEELTATTQQSAIAVEDVAKAVEGIAKGASEQAESTEKGALKINELGNAIENNLDLAKNLTYTSNRISEVVDNGLVEMENLFKITEESNKASVEIYDIIQKTNESASAIGEATNVIASIAEQTNLLALNASIEAARAGEAGRGFAVVADSIRKLAEESSKSANSIDEIVKKLQLNAENAVVTIENLASISKEQTKGVINSREKYLAIRDAVNEAIKAVDELNVSSSRMEELKNEILDMIQSLSALAEENSASTEEVTASMEEQNASIQEIASASEGLAKLAENLKSVIDRFKI